MVGEVPRHIPRGADVPDREQPPDLPGVLRQFAKNSRREIVELVATGVGKGEVRSSCLNSSLVPFMMLLLSQVLLGG